MTVSSTRNHSWVEVFVDGGWHFTGAAEPAHLDQTWFNAKAALNAAATATAPMPTTLRCQLRSDANNGIYATSFRATGLPFPLVWDASADTVWGIDVSARYIDRDARLGPAGVPVECRLGLVCYDQLRRRVPTLVVVSETDTAGQVVFEGTTNGDSADANDHLVARLPLGRRFHCQPAGGRGFDFETIQSEEVVEFPAEEAAELRATSSFPYEYDPEESARALLSDEAYLRELLGEVEGVDIDAAIARLTR